MSTTVNANNFDVGALYTGTYVKAADIGERRYSAIIAAVDPVEIAELDGRVKKRAAVTLQDWPAKLLLNKTNYETIARGYGRQSAAWVGRPLEVFADVTSFNGRSVACVRVHVPPSPATASATATPGKGPSEPPTGAELAAGAPVRSPSGGGEFKADIPY